MRALGQGYDIVHFHALGPGVMTPLTRYASRARVVQTVHGLDDERASGARGPGPCSAAGGG